MAHWREQICRSCGHVGEEHEANECWVEVDNGEQCPCGWMDLVDPPAQHPIEEGKTDDAG